MYTHSYSFNTDICLHIHSAEYTFRLLNQAGRNNYPYNPKYVGNTGIDFKFVSLLIYIKIEGQTKLEVNRTQNDHFGLQKAT